jgi:N-acetyl-gamma-glutamylphosphate reductase
MRVFAPNGHRHEIEIRQACLVPVRMTATAVEAVRGVQVVAHIWTTHEVTEKDVWKLYREAYRSEPFVRLVKQLKLKLIATREVITGGVRHVVIGDGRLPSPVYQALAGRGTVIASNILEGFYT